MEETWPSAVVKWQYRDDSGSWADMSDDDSARLEEVYAAHHCYLTLHYGPDVSYDFDLSDFGDWKQRRYWGNRPETLRDIRRRSNACEKVTVRNCADTPSGE